MGVRAGPGPPRRAGDRRARCRTSPRSARSTSIIVARGGGSLADLFCFCDETLCRTVALLQRAGDRIGRPPHRPHAARRRRGRQLLDADARRRGGRAASLRRRRATQRPRRPAAATRTARRAVLDRARPLARLSRAPAEHVARQRRACTSAARAARGGRGARIARARASTRTRAVVLRRKARGGARRRERARGARRSSGSRSRSPRTTPQRDARARLRARHRRRRRARHERRAARATRRDVRLRFADGDVDATIDDRRRDDRPEAAPPPTRRATARLEEIIRRLDSGEAGLRETLELVARGPRARRVVRRRARGRRPGARGAAPRRARRAAREREPAARDSETHEHLRAARRPAGDASSATSSHGLERNVSSELPARRTLIHLHGGGEEGIGEDVIYDADDHEIAAGRRADPAARGRLDARGRSASTSRRSTCSRAARSARPRVATTAIWAYESAALDLALRQAGTTLHEVLGRELRPLTLRRLAAPRRAADARAAYARASSATRRCASSSTRRPSWDDDARRRARGHRARSTRRLQGPLRGHGRRHAGRPRALPARRRGVPRRLDRGSQAHAGDRRGPARRIATASPGTRNDPLRRRHRRRCRSRRRWSTSSRRASGRCASCSPLYDYCDAARDRHVRRRPVRARPGPRADPVPRLALPSRHAERRRPGRLQRARAAARAARRARCRSPRTSTGLRWG